MEFTKWIDIHILAHITVFLTAFDIADTVVLFVDGR